MEAFFICLMSSGCIFILARQRLVVDLKELVIIEKFFPKYYCTPKKWMKHFLKIKYNTIPKHIYFHCYSIFLYLLLGVLAFVFMLFFDGKEVFEYYLCTQGIFAIVEAIVNIVFGKKLSLSGY